MATKLGTAGDDFIITGSDDDFVWADGVSQSITGGNDRISTGSGNDTVGAGIGNNTVDTGNGNDSVGIFAGGQNKIDTGLGNDTITQFFSDGGLGVGGAGADLFTGGGGSDRFVFQHIGNSSPAAPDTITDFKHLVDKINLSVIDGSSSNVGTAFAGQSANVVANSVTWHWAGGNTIVEADTTGDATADMTIILLGLINLTAADFVL